MVLLALPSVPAITSAFLLKLTTSLDDLLWLSPFLSLSPSVPNKLKHSVVYFFICLFVTMVAFVFGTSLLALTSSGSEGNTGYWNPERFLSIFSATVLFCIARNDYVEWKEEKNGHKVKDELQSPLSKRAIALAGSTDRTTIELPKADSNKTNLRSRPVASRQSSRDFDNDPELANGCDDDSDSDSDDEEIRAKIEDASKSLRRFVTVCVMGTLDDMIVFSAFVASGAGSSSTSGTGMIDNYLALFIGTTFAAFLIVSISWFFSEIECFKRMVKKIPMWGLLTGIAVYILFMGLI